MTTGLIILLVLIVVAMFMQTIHTTTLDKRVDLLEDAIRELNPGKDI